MSERISILNTPARRFFAAQLKYCSQVENDETGNLKDEWIYRGNKGSSMTFSQVWIQGFVVLVSTDGNDILVDDGTGIVHVTGVNKLVKNVKINKGEHIYRQVYSQCL